MKDAPESTTIPLKVNIENPPQEKEIYEYIPEGNFQTSLLDEGGDFQESVGAQQNWKNAAASYRGLTKEVLEDSHEARESYQLFHQKDKGSFQDDGDFSPISKTSYKHIRPSVELSPTPRLHDTARGKQGNNFLPSISYRRVGGAAYEYADEGKNDGTGILGGPFGSDLFETPLSRLDRLRIEVEELKEYITDYIANQPDENDLDENTATSVISGSRKKKLLPNENHIMFGDSASSLLLEVNTLYQKVKSISSDPRVEQLFSVDPISSKKSDYKALVKMVQGQQIANEPNAGDATSVKDKAYDGLSYEIYCLPSLSPLMEISRISSLENRLSEIEKRIGMGKAPLLPFPDLRTAVTSISKRLSALDLKDVEAISKRMHALLLELQAVQGRHREVFDSAMTDQRLEYLYDLCSSSKSIISSLPLIINRLKILKSIHNEAGGIAVRLSVLEGQQQEIQLLHHTLSSEQSNLKETVESTISWARRTAEALDSRMKSISPNAL